MDVSHITEIGCRSDNQDKFLIGEDRFVVCDGHGNDGSVFANFLVREAREFPKNVEGIEALFRRYSDPEQTPLIKIMRGGTTFCGAFKVDNGFLLVQLGDSRIFYRHKNTVYETNTHSASNGSNPDLAKLEEMGCEIIKSMNGSFYIKHDGSFLALTRRFGDQRFGKFVSCEPDFCLVEADALVLCSDGFDGPKKIVENLLAKRKGAADLLKWQDPTLDDNFTAIFIYND